MTNALVIFAAVLLAAAVDFVSLVVVGAVLARWARVPVDEAKLGWGPRLFRVTIAGAPVDVCLVWANASISFRGMNRFADYERPPAPMRGWPEVPTWQRLFIHLAPKLVPVLLAAVVLRGETVPDIVRGVLDFPAAFYGSLPLLDRALARYTQDGFVTLWALTQTKAFAVGLLGLPLSLAAAVGPRAKGPGVGTKVLIVSSVAILVTSVAWIVDFVRWVVTRS